MLCQLSRVHSDHPASSLRLDHPRACSLLSRPALPDSAIQPVCWRSNAQVPRELQLLFTGSPQQLLQHLQQLQLLEGEKKMIHGNNGREQKADRRAEAAVGATSFNCSLRCPHGSKGRMQMLELVNGFVARSQC